MRKQVHRMEIKVDPEFESIIPPLTDEEFKQLRDNVLEYGEVFDPIITWNGIIVDGHNRWKIIQANPDTLYKTKEIILSDRAEAIDWIYRNQLGRRNLTSEQRMRLIGQMQEARKQSHGGDRKSEESKVQNEPLKFESTADAIAQEVGVSKSTVKRAEKFSKGIDALEKVSKEAADKVLRGGSGVTKATIIAFPKMEPETKAKVAKSIVEDCPINHSTKKVTVEVEPPSVCVYTPTAHYNGGGTKEYRKQHEGIAQIVTNLYDPSTVPEYTAQDLVEEIIAIQQNNKVLT